MKYAILAICLLFPVVAFAGVTPEGHITTELNHSVNRLCWNGSQFGSCGDVLTKEQERAVLEKYGYKMPECVTVSKIVTAGNHAVQSCEYGVYTDCFLAKSEWNAIVDQAKHGGLCAD